MLQSRRRILSSATKVPVVKFIVLQIRNLVPGHGSKPFSCETEGQQRLSDGLARRWRRALGKKSPWICRSGTRQSASDSGAGALQLDGKIESLFAPEGSAIQEPVQDRYFQERRQGI